MSLKQIITEVEQDIFDVANTAFDYSDTAFVPSTNDKGLSYERGVTKRGMLLKSCVLYVDIRNSVSLTQKHQFITMGRIYTAFTKAVIKVSRHHGGHTRNIIGDRVMIVFPEEKCFKNAVSCAISINHIANSIKKQFPKVDFKCGIGIDYGELRIIKVGIQRNGTEASENKGLVWAGSPANLASRLTDMANKQFDEILFEVDYYAPNWSRLFRRNTEAFPSLIPRTYLAGGSQSTYSSIQTKGLMSESEFANSVGQNADGSMSIKQGKLISFKKVVNKIAYPSILITEEVLSGLKKEADPTFLFIWSQQKSTIKNVSSKTYGASNKWDTSKW